MHIPVPQKSTVMNIYDIEYNSSPPLFGLDNNQVKSYVATPVCPHTVGYRKGGMAPKFSENLTITEINIHVQDPLLTFQMRESS